MTRAYRLACRAFTVDVETDDAGTITRAPILARKFLGQPIENLTRWMAKYGGFSSEPAPCEVNLFDAAEATDPAGENGA
jgi:hypothetical protein